MKTVFRTAAIVAGVCIAGSASAFECKRAEASMDKPGSFPERALTMIVPYGPAGGSGQVAAAMAEAVTELTGVPINRDHKPGGSGTVGMTAYMAAPADGYNVLEHIDDASSAHALERMPRRHRNNGRISFSAWATTTAGTRLPTTATRTCKRQCLMRWPPMGYALIASTRRRPFALRLAAACSQVAIRIATARSLRTFPCDRKRSRSPTSCARQATPAAISANGMSAR